MTADAVVLDASVAIAILRRESPAPALLDFLHEIGSRGVRRLAPDGFWLELVNVLMRRYAATPEEAVEALRAIDDLDLESVRIDRPLLLVTLDLQARFGLSAYDAAYLALAETEDARLLTLDRQLTRAAGARAIRLAGVGEGRLSEEPAPYGEPVDWARFGAYLARLRADSQMLVTHKQVDAATQLSRAFGAPHQ